MARSLTVLVHAYAKVGKSTLASTSPQPVCILDAEGSTDFLPIRMKDWDPVREPPPVYDGTWDAAVVTVRNIQDVDKAFEWLVTGQHNFRSVVLDSVTEIQRKLKQQIIGADKPDWGTWDEILRQLDYLVRGFRDLTKHPLNPLLTCVVVCETIENKNDRLVPNLQGKIAPSVPFWFDLVGYLWMEPDRDPETMMTRKDSNGRTLKKRFLRISQDDPKIEAGERVQGRLPDIIENPNISHMLVTVFPELAEQNQGEQE